jgi:hypothetical protein
LLQDKLVWWASCWILSANPLAMLWSFGPSYNIKKTWCTQNLTYISCPWMQALQFLCWNKCNFLVMKKVYKKQVPHTLLDSWVVNPGCLTQVATLGLVDNQGCPCAHNILQLVAFYARNVSNLCPQLQSFFAISTIYNPLCQDLKAMRDYRKKPQKHFEATVMLVQEKLELTK